MGRPESPDGFEVNEPTTLAAAQEIHAEKTEKSAALANIKGGYKMRGGATPESKRITTPFSK